MRTFRNLAVTAAFLASLVCASHAQAAAGVKIGVLTCNEASGWGFVFASTRDINCTYSPNGGVLYRYTGHISKFGVDLGYIKGGVIVWGVFAPSRDMGPDALAGDYAGGTAGVSLGVGVAANALIGGSSKSISLQPLSIEGEEGINIAAGIGEMSLHYQGPAPTT